MRMASVIASVIAHAKQQTEIQLGDVIAGIHVTCFERLLPFWPSAAVFEDFVADYCDWSEHRLATWDRWTFEQLHPTRGTLRVPFTGWSVFLRNSKRRFFGKNFTQSKQLQKVYGTAEALTPNRVTTFGQVVPLVTPELFLFAVTRTPDVELGKQLAASGLHLDALEQLATAELASPEKLMF
jgi:hypothetical protein